MVGRRAEGLFAGGSGGAADPRGSFFSGLRSEGSASDMFGMISSFVL